MTDNRPWVEKYRPTRFEDIVLDPLNQETTKEYCNAKQISKSTYFTVLLELVKPQQL